MRRSSPPKGLFRWLWCLSLPSLLLWGLCLPGIYAQETPESEVTVPQSYQEGERLFEEGKYREAAEAFREAAQSAAHGEPGGAEDTSENPGSGAPEQSEPPYALPLHALDVQPELPSHQQYLEQAEHLLEGKSFEEAFAAATRAVALDPSREAKRLLNRTKKAFQSAQRRAARKARLMRQAEEADRRGKERRALDLWKRALRVDHEDQGIQAAIQSIQARGARRAPTMQRAVQLQAPSTHSLIREYQVSEGDVLQVFVWQHPDLSRDVIVRPDGRLSFPLVGDLEAAGNTLTNLDYMLTGRLKTYIRLPDVSLAIKRFGGVKTIILGEVTRPGVYVPAGEGRVLDVIAMAGGFTEKAKLSDVMLIRGGLKTPELAKLDLKLTLERGNVEENVRLHPNDIIFVPKGTIPNVLDFMAQFNTLFQDVLIGQNIATNFGVRETSGGITR